MKRILLLCTLWGIIALSVFAQDKKNVNSKMNSAVVFFQGAELTHTASYKLEKGENEIYIQGLSPRIDKNSLKIKASNKVLITSYEYSVDYITEKTPDEVIKKIQDSIRLHKDKLEQTNININVTNNLMGALQSGIEKNVSGSENGLPIDELVKTMDYYKEKSKELRETQAKLNREKEELNGLIAKLQKQLAQDSLKNGKDTGVLKLNLSSPLATDAMFTVSYYTPSAGWAPFYDINIISTDVPVSIMMKSKVFQTTGMDWEKIKLTLSSAVPSNGKTAPLFTTWFLDYYQYAAKPRSNKEMMLQNSYSYESAGNALENKMPGIQVRGTAPVKSNKKPIFFVDGVEVAEDYITSLQPDMIKQIDVLKDASSTAIYGSRGENGVILITLKDNLTVNDYVIKEENDLNVIYNIDIPYTIPGNGKQQLINIGNKATKAEYKYYCAPKLDKATYLLGEISDWEKLGLLSGRANITYDGTYVGETYIDALSTSEKLALTLGIDSRVSVKRELMQDFSSTKFIGSDVYQEFTYKLTVRNNQNKAVKMVLKDQYPVSSKREIIVEFLTKNTTPFTANKNETGVVTWEEELNAGETKEYRFSYSVKYPKGKKLNF